MHRVHLSTHQRSHSIHGSSQYSSQVTQYTGLSHHSLGVTQYTKLSSALSRDHSVHRVHLSTNQGSLSTKGLSQHSLGVKDYTRFV